VSVQTQVKSDLEQAMRAGEKKTVGALRLVLSELQKAAKEGGDDEVAVLRRERKRRLDAAEQYRQAAREDLADAEEAEAVLITAYLPAELDDAELDRLVSEAIAETGAGSPQEMGKVMGALMPKVGGRADGQRVSAKVKDKLSA
jgi:uncharacterized protein